FFKSTSIMSYDISVYPIAFFEKTKELNLDFNQVMDFMEKKENLVPFTPEQIKDIKSHLDYRKYVVDAASESRTDYSHKTCGSVSVMLTPTGLFFNARGEDVMEISMTAAEFCSSYGLRGNFALWDAHNNGWKV
ncbi:MAG: hypothetical protein ACRCYO_17560, partial [Bacteroidia bacterium]